ncbi:UDP-N-acetylglucosamine--dolichyl-phosphate N-acetylglucosaminephosphotransferase [Ananas comosus]|uniref:UDP-N-acetylglucosamine--dolichyl-phosphate N-acetylglucosaminephosphotransferase n=1 Tax=Ananas comosus TaxID=4615 RepID=A0A199VMG6_ANACO|nr:UDP-N-acetylglucosamine--dolichyl-phosphate N-acetylglucosaminephosphotransferase [Ananas comosus]
MATRRRPPSSSTSSAPPIADEVRSRDPKPSAAAEDPPLAPPKLGFVAAASALFFVPFFYLAFVHYPIEPDLRRSIAISVAMSFGGFLVALRMIPVAARYVLRRNLFGYDINKRGTPQGTVKVPESLGIVIGIVYLVIAILFQHFNFTSDSNWLVEYNAALACICFMVLLGFVDDVLDIPWRVKLVLPSFAALPLLMAYAGHTSIVIPKPLIPYVGVPVLDLGWIYKLYMGMLAVFCTNSINIHAGLNGLEVGQTVVISAAVLIHNIMQIGASTDPEYKQAHAFSIYLVLPLLATSLALLSYNWYPSSVFVGDTYTYFAGMALAVVGILGHFSETLLLFFLPQVLNFLYSCPQLFKIIPCPRHRLPKFDPQTGLLTGTKDGTLVNLFLRLFGRCTERALCIKLLIFQAMACLLCFWLRYILAGWYK